MKRIIKSVELHKYSVIVTTKSNVQRVYQFTNQQNKLNYYNDLVREMNYDNMSWQNVYDKMSMTKSHSGILVNVNYQLNNVYTFIQSKY